MIRRCAEPLDKFPVTEEMVANLLDRGKSLKEEMQVGDSGTIIYIYV